MKRLLLWLIGVALGVVVLLAAVLGVSYSFTSEGAKPVSEVQFAGQELEPNGWCWQVPLLGGQVDKVFASPRTLTVQKLGVHVSSACRCFTFAITLSPTMKKEV